MSAPLCAGCGSALVAWHCDTCRTTNGTVRGVLGEDMPGAEWTAEVRLGATGDTRLVPRMRCAVSVGDEYGPHAWTQIPADRWDEGQWVTQAHGFTAGVIFAAWGEAMLARAKSAEWVLDEQARRRAVAAA